MDREDSYEGNGSHDILDHDRERDQDRNRDRYVQGNVKSIEGCQGPSHVGLRGTGIILIGTKCWREDPQIPTI